MSTKATRAWWGDDRTIYAVDKRKRTHKRTPRGELGKLLADYMRRTGATRREALDALAADKAAHAAARSSDVMAAVLVANTSAAKRDGAERAAIAQHKAQMRQIDNAAARDARIAAYLLNK